MFMLVVAILHTAILIKCTKLIPKNGEKDRSFHAKEKMEIGNVDERST